MQKKEHAPILFPRQNNVQLVAVGTAFTDATASRTRTSPILVSRHERVLREDRRRGRFTKGFESVIYGSKYINGNDKSQRMDLPWLEDLLQDLAVEAAGAKHIRSARATTRPLRNDVNFQERKKDKITDFACVAHLASREGEKWRMSAQAVLGDVGSGVAKWRLTDADSDSSQAWSSTIPVGLRAESPNLKMYGVPKRQNGDRA